MPFTRNGTTPLHRATHPLTDQLISACLLTIEATPNGPYLVTGSIELRDADGKVLPTKSKVWLCRCGASTKKPFCDGTHSKIGFQAAAKAVPGSAEGG